MTSNLATLLPLFLVMGNVFAIITCPYTHQFQPIPNRRVGAYCTWEVKLNTVYNRIPQTITEIICESQHEPCGGQTNYKCSQIETKMAVAYIDLGVNIIYQRNITVSVGCACVQQHSTGRRLNLQQLIEKKSAPMSYYYY